MGKMYNVHEPEVACIAKGKAGKKYEFGNKVSLAATSKGEWLLGALSLLGNPYDGRTLDAQLAQVRRLVTTHAVKEGHVDMGYRGNNHQGPETIIVDKRRRGTTLKRVWKWMKRRAAIEPTIGHLKAEHRLERNRLKGTQGNAINALLSAAAMNFQKLLGFFLCRLLHFLRSLFVPASRDQFFGSNVVRCLFQDRLIKVHQGLGPGARWEPTGELRNRP
jgi:IS5 family transposase